MFNKIQLINQGLVKMYPDGNTPYQIMTRLLEEAGELAQQVNHFEKSGVKNQKYGLPERQKLAKEIQDVIRCALQIMVYYNVEPDVKDSVEKSLNKLLLAGLVELK